MQLEVSNVTKYYHKKKALDHVSFTLENGIYGLLGVNGAGKSTLINILVTSLEATEGQILYEGKDIRANLTEWLSVLGYMPQTLNFYRNYTVEEFLQYVAALKKIHVGSDRRIRCLLNYVNLYENRNKKIGALSGGMLRRVGIAQALLNNPKILILDEPTAGLDPKERIRFRNLISGIAADRMILLATHIVEDIEYIADEVLFLHNGMLIAKDSPETLCRNMYGKVWEFTARRNALNEILPYYKISSVQPENDRCILRIVSEKKPFASAVPTTARLEDFFLWHVGESV